MNFHPRNRRGSDWTRVFWWLIGFVILILILNLFRTNPLARFFGRIGAPIWRAETAVSEVVGGWLAYLVSKEQLAFDNELLQAELEQANRQLLDLAKIESGILNSPAKPEGVKLPVEILLKPPRTLYDTILIGAGEDANLSANALVVVDNVVLGRVTEVFGHQAKVSLFSAPGSELTVTIALSSGEMIQATAYGEGAGNFRIRLPKGVAISVGDSVTLPEAGNRLLGPVGQIFSSPADPFQFIFFRYPVNLATLRQVVVLLSPAPRQEDKPTP